MWGSYLNIPKAIFYLLKGDYSLRAFEPSGRVQEFAANLLSIGELGTIAKITIFAVPEDYDKQKVKIISKYP